MIDTIIFDGEGIVIDTESIWDRGQEEFLRRRGFVYDRARIKPQLTGRSLIEGVLVMQREYGFSGDPEAQARERMEIVKQAFRDEARFIDGFPAFFQSVRDRYKTCIATAMAEDLLDIVVQRLDLRALFDDRIFSLTNVAFRSKPEPDLFLFAANKLGSSTGNCVVIEDAPHGIEAARRAGMRCIAITTTYRRKDLTLADMVVDTYDDIDLAAVSSA